MNVVRASTSSLMTEMYRTSLTLYNRPLLGMFFTKILFGKLQIYYFGNKVQLNFGSKKMTHTIIEQVYQYGSKSLFRTYPKIQHRNKYKINPQRMLIAYPKMLNQTCVDIQIRQMLKVPPLIPRAYISRSTKIGQKKGR